MAKTPSRASAEPKKVAPAKRRTPPKKPPHPATNFIAQTEAKNRFLPYCRHAINTGEYVCVLDSPSQAFLTLTPRTVKGEFVTVSAQFFKDNFSRCSSLIRDGVAFRLTLRGLKEVIYARRHTSYNDPLDAVIDRWREKIVESALADADESAIARLARDFAAFTQREGARSDEDRETARTYYTALVRGITRMAIGHKPFEEGMMVSLRDPTPRQDGAPH
jgi:hypothetical protein